jgi:hypothetical protein
MCVVSQEFSTRLEFDNDTNYAWKIMRCIVRTLRAGQAIVWLSDVKAFLFC